VSNGVYNVGSAYRSLAVEFKDHIVLVDPPPPASAPGAAAIIEQIKLAVPNKPITKVILTHLHFDHAGGARIAAAEGTAPVTIVTNEMNKAVIEKWFSNPRTLQAQSDDWPDALAKSKKTVKFEYVKDKLVLKDDTMTVEVHPIKGVVHSEDMMIVYVPSAKLVFESDAYNPGAAGATTNPTQNSGQLAFQKLLASELDRLKLDYNIIVATHQPGGDTNRDVTKQDLMTAIGRK
jgi:glyoxylase-like metal-dependent hydrolase (beta-lactamase superfamily II)